MADARRSTPLRRGLALGLTLTVLILLAISCADGQAGAGDAGAPTANTPSTFEVLAHEVDALTARFNVAERGLTALTPEHVDELQALRNRLAARAVANAGGASATHGFDVPGGRCGGRGDNTIEHFLRLESGRWGGIEIVRCEE